MKSAFQRELELRSERALAVGALQPIGIETHVVEDGEVAFAVRLLANSSKEKMSRAQKKRGEDPFLPYDPELFVADLSESHVALLNKFNVLDHHMLVVTRQFEPQDAPLTHGDFAAAWFCMESLNGLVFYNSGPLAGASQPHKHLQLVPLPIGAGPEPTPVDCLVRAAEYRGGVGVAPGLPFRHALAKLAPDPDLGSEAAGELALARYMDLCAALALTTRPRPYNLLFTREWMLMVPRAQWECEGIPVNGIAFSGTLLVRDRAELERVRQRGPLNVLRGVCEPS